MTLDDLELIILRARDRFPQNCQQWQALDTLAIETYNQKQEAQCKQPSPPTSASSSPSTSAPAAETNGFPATPVLRTTGSVSWEALVSHLKKNDSPLLVFENGAKLYITQVASGVYHFSLELDGSSPR